MARPPRIERGTLCLEGRCSIQLSYGREWPAALFAGFFSDRKSEDSVGLRIEAMGGLWLLQAEIPLVAGQGQGHNLLSADFEGFDGNPGPAAAVR
jgi:hypothetical protein